MVEIMMAWIPPPRAFSVTIGRVSFAIMLAIKRLAATASSVMCEVRNHAYCHLKAKVRKGQDGGGADNSRN
jgi:hypothetical protein